MFNQANNVVLQLCHQVIGMVLIAMLLTSPVSAADEFTILPPPQKISKHVYAWLGPHGGPSKVNKGFRMNLAFVVGNKEVAVIESGYSDAMAKEMLRHISAITPFPVKHVINTNSQSDRMMGTATFMQHGAKVYTSQGELQRMQQRVSDYATFSEKLLGVKLGKATIPEKFANKIVKDQLKINLGNVSLKVINHGITGHTPEPLIVEIVEDKMVWAGDTLYAGRLPAVIPGSDVPQWRQLFDKLRSYKDVTFIPGHGKPAPLSAFEKSTYSYLKLLHDHMKRSIDDGVDLQDAMETLDQKSFSYLANYEQLAGRNASWTYTQMEAAAFE